MDRRGMEGANEHLYSSKAEIQIKQYNIKYNTI